MADDRDLFAKMPPIPTTAAPTVVFWDSGPDPTGTVGRAGLRPTEEAGTTQRIAFSLLTDQGATLASQVQLSDGSWRTTNNSGAGEALTANTLFDSSVDVSGAGRRRVVGIFATAPAVWLTSATLRMSKSFATAHDHGVLPMAHRMMATQHEESVVRAPAEPAQAVLSVAPASSPEVAASVATPLPPAVVGQPFAFFGAISIAFGGLAVASGVEGLHALAYALAALAATAVASGIAKAFRAAP